MSHIGLGGFRLPFGHGQTRKAIKEKIVPKAQAFSPAQTFSPAGRPVASAVGGGTIFQGSTGRQFTAPIAPKTAIEKYLQPAQISPISSGAPSGGGVQTQAPTTTDGGGITAPSLESFQQPLPEQSSIDFDAMIAPALEGLESAIAPLQAGTEETVRGIEATRGTQVARTQAEFGAQERGLERARGRQEQLGESAASEARRQFAEFQQGVGARYGRRTSTGQAAAEIGATQTFRNIANIRQQVSEAMLQLDDKLQQVREIGRISVQEIEDSSRQQTSQARNQLQLQMADIRRQKGELMGRKAELASQAIQIYQNTVNQIQAQNAAFRQNIFLQQMNAENQLKLAQQKATRVVSSFTPFGFTNVKPGESLFRTNKKTGE